MTGWSVRHEADVRQSAFGPVIVLEDPELPLLVHHLQARPRGMATAKKEVKSFLVDISGKKTQNIFLYLILLCPASSEGKI